MRKAVASDAEGNLAVKAGEQYFIENLAEHFGHKVEIARYTDMYTNKVTDYRLHCAEEDCESPVGIAVEVVSTEDGEKNA